MANAENAVKIQFKDKVRDEGVTSQIKPVLGLRYISLSHHLAWRCNKQPTSAVQFQK